MHVMTWIIFDCTYMITTIQLLALGTYIVLNKRQATFPGMDRMVRHRHRHHFRSAGADAVRFRGSVRG